MLLKVSLAVNVHMHDHQASLEAIETSAKVHDFPQESKPQASTAYWVREGTVYLLRRLSAAIHKACFSFRIRGSDGLCI